MIPDPAKFYDEVYCKIGGSITAVEQAMYGAPHQRERRDKILKVLKAEMQPRMDALDLGCAGGWFTAVLAAACKSVVGVDVVPWLIVQAPKFDNVTYMVADWNDLDFPDGTFDLIFATSVFEHEPEVDRLAARTYAWLRPGGKLIASVPVSEELLTPDKAFAVITPDEARTAGQGSGHVHAFRPETFKELLEKHGWTLTQGYSDGIYYLVVGVKP